MQRCKKSITRTATATLAGVGLALTGVGAGLGASTAHADAKPQAASCSNRLFMVDGYHNTTTGLNFKNEPTAPGWQNVLFKYESGIIPVIDPQTLNETVSKAVPNLEHEAIAYHQACPNAKIAFHGYSFGALIAGNVVADLASKSVIPHQQLNAVLYGDPRRAPQTKGLEGKAGGVLTMLPNIPSIDAPGPRDFKDIDVSEVCHENDVICNAANPFTNANAVINEVMGYTNGDHGYPMNPYGADSHPGDHFIAQQHQWYGYGAPLPIAVGTPNELLNSNPAYLAAVKGLNEVFDKAGLIDILNGFGLPGQQLVDTLRTFLNEAGVAY